MAADAYGIDGEEFDDLEEILREAVPVRQFRTIYPHVHVSDGALWGELKDRHRNGLADAGAVVEKLPPGRTKPQLLVVPSRYFGWLRGITRVSGR